MEIAILLLNTVLLVYGLFLAEMRTQALVNHVRAEDGEEIVVLREALREAQIKMASKGLPKARKRG